MAEVKTYKVISVERASGCEYVEPYTLIATSAELTEDGWLRPAPTEQTR